MRLHPENITELDFSKSADGLLPAVVQDWRDGRVLMVGYVSVASLQLTFSSSHVTFYSRSKRRLWTKGESSGNVLELHSAWADCDQDSVLLYAKPTGPVCHTGADTCFSASEPHFLLRLEALLNARQPDADSESYTSRLLAKGVMKVAQKVGEEGVEMALEAVGGTDALLTEEAADLMYHYLLLLRAKGQGLADVVEVLERRHK